MKIRHFITAKQNWLLCLFSIIIFAHIPVRVYGVDIIPAGTYVTFSTVYNGKRYYLGVDTAKVNAGTDTVVTAFDKPNYATMWALGEERGAGSGSYLRTLKNVWLKERKLKDKFLSIQDASTYGLLVITDTAQSTLWTTANDERVQSKYTQGFLYHYAEKNGLEVYRYLTYDPLYGFSRLYSTRPSASQRMSVWDRKTGNDVTCTMTPSSHTFGLNRTDDTVKLHITSRVFYYKNVNRFRSRYDQTDILVNEPEVIDDQTLLAKQLPDEEGPAPYAMYGYYEWASNPRADVIDPTMENLGDYNGKSIMKYYGVTGVTCADPENPTPETCTATLGEADSTMLMVKFLNYRKLTADDGKEVWHDTVYAIGRSPFDIHEAIDNSDGTWSEGGYKDHTDWLRQHYWIKNGSGVYEHFADSIMITRRTFHTSSFVTVSATSSPNDHVFPYTNDNKKIVYNPATSTASEEAITASDTAFTFGVSGTYKSGYNTLYANNDVAATFTGREYNLDIHNRKAYYDTNKNRWYDTLRVEVLLPDGSASAVGSDATHWIESFRLIDRDSIRVKVNQGNPSATLRTAQIRYSYCYRNEEGDTAEVARVIWISQKYNGQDEAAYNAQIYSFSHAPGKGNTGEVTGPQPVHTKTYTMYGIPGEELELPLHRDHWGYYRWYVWSAGANKDKDALYDDNWEWGTTPQNHLEDDEDKEFMLINNSAAPSSRGRWDISMGNPNHLDVTKPTNIPTLKYKTIYVTNSVSDASDKKDTIACDVSAYTDIETEGTVGESLTALTEPTLSYRNLFEILPAKTQANKMADCRVHGGAGHNGWMEEHEVLVPAGRAFSLVQQHPVQDGETDVVEESHLQYIHYFNPDAKGNVDNNMGTKSGSYDYNTAACYNRIGKTRYTETVSLTLLNLDSLRDAHMPRGTSKKVLMVNPRRGSGYVMGLSDDNAVGHGNEGWSSLTDAESLRTFTTTYANQDAFIITLYKNNDGSFTLTAADDDREFTAYYGTSPSYGWTVRWPGHVGSYATNKVYLATFTGNPAEMNTIVQDRIVGEGDTTKHLFALYMDVANTLFHREYEGYVIARQYNSGTGAYTRWENAAGRSKNKYDVRLTDTGSNAVEFGDYANLAWCFYEIDDRTPHTETPYWEYSANGSDWRRVATKDTANSRYTMLADGSLSIGATVHREVNLLTPVYYRLRTEHFNLAKYTVYTTNPVTDGPSNSVILSEDSIQNHFDILYTLGNDLFPAPGTTNEKAYYHHMPWSFTELSYHYPVGTGDHEIPSTNRVYNTFLPARGEYAYINKFVDPTNIDNVTESMSGAQYGYMMCINVSQKPVTIFDFEYPSMPCADQNIYLTVNLCNPVQNTYNPQITADLEGWNGSAWIPIYRYKTGEIPYVTDVNRRWHQLVLPINQAYLDGYQKFRCVATMPGSMQSNSYVLIDRMRFIAKERPVTVFQSKGACIQTSEGGDVDIIARLDYQNTSYEEGTLIAFQYQKKNRSTGNYEALPTEGVGAVTYINDAGEGALTDTLGNGCGAIRIPAAEFVPARADSVGINDVNTRNRCYVNEGTKVKPYYVMYLSQQVHAAVGDTFRVAMVPLGLKRPDFSKVGCATERVIPIDNPVDIHVSGCDTVWKSYTRAQLEAGAGELSIPNKTYTVTATINDLFLPGGGQTGSGKCMFDLVRTTKEDQEFGNDEWFHKRFGCTRQQFREIMKAFRMDHENNTLRLETDWSKVTPEKFRYVGSGCSEAKADSMYTILNRLIVDSAFIEIGLSSIDVYLGDSSNAYMVLWPIPASGTYIDAASSQTRSVSVCSAPRWFEIHANNADYSLRFGFDNMWEGDYYLVPVIRATRTAANAGIQVRLAEITHDASKVAVMGYGATTIVGTNDSIWKNAVGETFSYRPNKDVRGADPNTYYYAGDTVTFTKNGTYNLRAGYWYKFRTPYYHGTVGASFSESGVPTEYAEFIVAVAPDTVRWTPAHPESANYWNDDNNWTPLMANMPVDGFKATVPMGNTKVIIPQVSEGLLPIVSDLVVEQKDTLDFGYVKNTCKKILFKERSQMLGQEKLNYDTAYVDVLLKTGNWQTFTPALKHIYSGDFYIPFDAEAYNPAAGNESTGASVDTVDFAPKPFPYTTGYSGAYNPRSYPFAFYQGFYNSSVPVAFYNTDENDNPVATTTHTSKSVVDWVRTNSLDVEYVPGKACVLNSYDAYDKAGNEIVVRLPKQETTYYAYGKNGENYVAGQQVTISRGTLTHNLAYDKYTLGASDGIEYTLTNEIESNIFFFGNPTMSLIDVYELCNDNELQLQKDGDKHQFTSYQLSEGSTYMPQTVNGPGQYFVAPQRAVGLIANATNTSAKSLTIKLKPHALVALTGDGKIVSHDDLKKSAPQRRAADGEAIIAVESNSAKRLYITASNETNKGVQKAYLTLGEQADASRGFVYGEDAKSLSSGEHYFNSGSFATPLNLYTIADNEALMMDIRDTLSCVPVIFSTLDSVWNTKGVKVSSKYLFDEYTTLSFATDGVWDRPLYLYDAVTNDSLMILNGLRVSVRTPLNNQLRYFINGVRRATTNQDQQGTTTDLEVVDGDDNSYTVRHTQYTVIYDVLGRRLMTLNEYDLISNIQLPTGVYIIQRGDHAERMVIR